MAQIRINNEHESDYNPPLVPMTETVRWDK